MSTVRAALRSPAARLTAALSALFAGLGVSLPFLSRWLATERGLDGVQIGAILSGASLVRVLTGPVIGAWADGLADRRTAVRVLSIGAALGYSQFFVTRGFGPLLVAGFVGATLLHGMTPLLEGALLRQSQGGPLPYGIARGIGSAAFIVGNVVGGWWIARAGAPAAAVWMLGAYLLVAVICWTVLLPEPSAPGPDFRGRLAAIAALARHPPFLRVLLAAGLVQAAHAFYYGFSALIWAADGIGADTIGQLWAFGVLVETGFLWSLPRFEAQVAPETLLWVGALGGVARWCLLGLSPPLPWLWPLQSLHAVSFAAAHVGALRIVHRDAPQAVASGAQTLYAGFTGGTMTGLVTLASGFLYEGLGARGYFAMAALAATSVALLRRR